MIDHPKSIDRRIYTCKNCSYQAQVYGESYFDHGSQNYIGTYLCKDCKVLFESYLTKIKEWDTEGDFVYDLADETMCLRCGRVNSIGWNKDQGRCPKCDSVISFSVNGKININPHSSSIKDHVD
jgi:DNA-directed RNA polymerase subunit RPC12/RpoP